MRLKVIGVCELNRMRRNHRQMHACSQCDTGRNVGFVVQAPSALNFQIKAVRKNP